MNTAELTEKFAHQTGLKQNIAKAYVDILLNAMSDELIFGDGEIKLTNLFTVNVVQGKERCGRNISTGEALSIPAKKRLKLKASKNLIDQMNH